jgi:hypothetical protein
VIGGRVLDASTLVDFALVRPYPQALVWTAVEAGMVLAVPAAALTSAWALTPADARDALSVLLQLPNTVIETLDGDQAQVVGLLLADTAATSGVPADGVRAGQVVACGRRRGWPIVTGAPDLLRKLDDRVEVDELP